MQDVRLTLFTLSEPCDLLRSRDDLYHGRRYAMLTVELPNSAYHSGKHPIKQEIVLFVCFHYDLFLYFCGLVALYVAQDL